MVFHQHYVDDGIVPRYEVPQYDRQAPSGLSE